MSARTTSPVIAAALTLVFVAACTSTTSSGSGTGGIALAQSGKLLTCTQLPYEPFQVKKGNEVVGFDVDMIDLVAKELKVKQEIVDTPFEGIKSGEDLNTNKCDVAAAGMTILPERAKNFDFSDPYFTATQSLLVKKGAPYTSMASLKGKTLAVQLETTGEIYAKKHAKGVELRQFEDLGLLLSAVKAGKVDAGINDNGVLYDFVKKNTDMQVTADFNTGEKYGFGVRKGNDKLRAKINEVIKKSRSDGSYDRIYKKWFGTAPKK